MLHSLLTQLKEGQSLSVTQSQSLMNQLLEGLVSDDDIVSLLTSLDKKTLSSNEMLGFLDSLGQFCLPFQEMPNAIDTCGTGGSVKSRFNISTCVAFVVAAAGYSVAKHGNYGSQKANGSFDFLEALDIPFKLEPKKLEQLLAETKLCFLFARLFHPAMRHVVAARKLFGKRSVFNLLGPLANPAQVKYQLIGMPNTAHLELLIDVVKKRNMKKVLFVIGGDERDEISLDGTSKIVEVCNNKQNEYHFNFQTDIKAINPEYDAGDSIENAALFSDVLDKKAFEHPLVDHICINAAAAFLTLDIVSSLPEGYQKAKSLFESGKLSDKIKTFKMRAHQLATTTE